MWLNITVQCGNLWACNDVNSDVCFGQSNCWRVLSICRFCFVYLFSYLSDIGFTHMQVILTQACKNSSLMLQILLFVLRKTLEVKQNSFSELNVLETWASPEICLTFWHRSFTFNSNKSPTWCNIFSVYYPEVCLQLNMFRAFSRPTSRAQWQQWQPLVLPSYRGDSSAVFVVGPAGVSE
jgi:hypothetical protein